MERTVSTQCCIAGGGPAGMMLGLLLARAGVRVAVLEQHSDFLRDFRGDTVHPSTLEILSEIGIKAQFDALPQARVEQIRVQFAHGLHPIVDFRDLEPFSYVALVPQWDFLDLLAAEAKRHPTFELHMNAKITDVVREGKRVAGVQAQTPSGGLRVLSQVVVACDGRGSRVRASLDMRCHEIGAPMDVLWFRIPRDEAAAPAESFGIAGRGRFMGLLQRGKYWQIAYVIPKGTLPVMRQKPIESFRAEVSRRAPFLAEGTSALASWSDVKLLEVRIDRLRRWFGPGVLLIGDAAHAMSPIGAVGVNLAIQDAVAAANALTSPLLRGRAPSLLDLARVQARRELPTRVVQAIQVAIQRRLIAPSFQERDDGLLEMPVFLRRALELPRVRSIPARLFGLGIVREHVAYR